MGIKSTFKLNPLQVKFFLKFYHLYWLNLSDEHVVKNED